MNQGGKKICQHNQKMDKRIEKSLHKKERVANKHIKRCLISRVIREMQSKTSTRYNCTSNRWAKLKKKKNLLTPEMRKVGKHDISIAQEKLCYYLIKFKT